jgi:hypothetical protein
MIICVWGDPHIGDKDDMAKTYNESRSNVASAVENSEWLGFKDGLTMVQFTTALGAAISGHRLLRKLRQTETHLTAA